MLSLAGLGVGVTDTPSPVGTGDWKVGRKEESDGGGKRAPSGGREGYQEAVRLDGVWREG